MSTGRPLPAEPEEGTKGTDVGEASTIQGLPYHGQTAGAGEDFSERECVMGQTVFEEKEEEESIGEEVVDEDLISDEFNSEHVRPDGVSGNGRPNPSTGGRDIKHRLEQDHGAHMTNKVRNAKV